MLHPRFFRRLVARVLVAIAAFNFPPPTAFAAMADHATQSATSMAPRVVIGEIAWAGSSRSTADEWLELWNLGAEPISLAGWTLRGASADPLAFPSGATIEPNGVYLISNYASGDAKSVLATTTHFVTTAVSLSNSNERIELLDPTGAVADVAGTGGAPLAGISGTIKTTMIRTNPDADGSVATAWTSATTSRGMIPSVTDFGTPGWCDVPSTPIQSAPPYVTPTTTDPIPDPAQADSDLVDSTSTATLTDILIDATTSGTTDELSATSDASSTTLADIAVASTSTPSVSIGEQSTTTTVGMTNDAMTNSQFPISPTQSATLNPQQLANSVPETAKPAYGLLRLNEVAPAETNEWVEIVTLDASNPISLAGCTLHDSTGRIATIGKKTIDPLTNRYLKLTFSSNKLNNSGDAIALYAPDGRLLDALAFGPTKKGMSWIRSPDLAGDWQLTASQTPGGPNAMKAPAVSTAATDQAVASTSSVQHPVEPDIPFSLASESAPRETVDRETNVEQDPSILALEKEADRILNEMAAPAKAKRTTNRAAKKSVPMYSITFDMLTREEYTGIRVRLAGRVGTPAGILTSRTFVLLNADGRGLPVTLGTRQRMPSIGSDIQISGTLRLNDLGAPSLKLTTKDVWTKLATSTEPVRPRIVDLLAPSAEDAWSFVHVTGTVKSISGSTVHLDLGDAELDAIIKPATKYRVKRLAVGDTVTVSGVLDTTRDEPRLIARVASDIAILSHAKPTSKDSELKTMGGGVQIPGWAPIGAAAGAVAATEGAKQLHRRRKVRKLERRAEAMAAA